jgi:uncharacterized protein YggE
LLDKAIEAGANRQFEIELGSSKEDELRSKAMENAVADAKRQATTLAEQFGAKLGRVYSISHEEGFGGVMHCVLGPTFGEGTFQPGRIEISAEIAVVFELADD